MNNKKNNNEALEKLKNDLKDVANKIPKSETVLFLEFMNNVWAKMFVLQKDNKILDIRSVIVYIEYRVRNSKNKQHQAFWTKIFKMLIDFRDKLEKT